MREEKKIIHRIEVLEETELHVREIEDDVKVKNEKDTPICGASVFA